MTIELPEEKKIKLLNSDDVYSVMQEILLREEKIDQEKEHFWMIGLATNQRILYIELVSLGSVNATTVEPMNVFRVAVMKGAVRAIMVQNHPSGELRPSEADKDLTDRLIQVGRILNVPVLDHMIISPRSYFSFLESGLMEALSKSLKWVPQYEIEQRIREEEKKLREEAARSAKLEGIEEGMEKGKEAGKKEGIEIGRVEGEVEKALEIARIMKRKGFDIAIIMEVSGLGREVVEGL